jgi:hypothetical protein
MEPIMPKKPTRRVRYEFTVEVDGKTYCCESVVSGVRVLTQRVTVKGIGSENDAASYGRSDHPVVSMPGVAELIATNIIAKQKREGSPK